MISQTSEHSEHDITYSADNVVLFKCDGRNRLAQGGAGVAAWNDEIL